MLASVPYIQQFYGEQLGRSVIIDSHGRKLELHRRSPGPAFEVHLLGRGNKPLRKFQFQDGAYSETESDESGDVFRKTLLDPLNGDIVTLDFRFDLVAIYRTEQDGAASVIVFCEGALAFTETISNVGQVKRCEYDNRSNLLSVTVSATIGGGREGDGDRPKSIVAYAPNSTGDPKRISAESITGEFRSMWQLSYERKIEEMELRLADGMQVSLKRNPRSGFLQGTANGPNDFTADAAIDADYMLLLKSTTNAADRRKTSLHTEWTTPGFRSSEQGFERVQFDKISGTLRRFDDKGNGIVQKPGRRKDIHDADGNIMWTGRAGDTWYCSSAGDVVLGRPDGTSITMQVAVNGAADLIEIHGLHDTQQFEIPEPAKQFMISNRGSYDLRDCLQVFTKFMENPVVLHGIFQQLSQIAELDSGSLVGFARLVAGVLLNHLANPGEITTGSAPTYGAAAVQTFFALGHPVRYVAIVKEVLSTAELRLAGGSLVPLDLENLVAADRTGRDAVSRAFQTLVMRIANFPNRYYRNCESGLACLEKGHLSVLSSSLNAPQISSVIFLLGGGETAVTDIRSQSELQTVARIAGQKPFLCLLNANSYPLCEPTTGETYADPAPSNVARFANVLVCDSGFSLYFPLLSDASDLPENCELPCEIVWRNMFTLKSKTDDNDFGIAIVPGGTHGARHVVSGGTLVRVK